MPTDRERPRALLAVPKSAPIAGVLGDILNQCTDLLQVESRDQVAQALELETPIAIAVIDLEWASRDLLLGLRSSRPSCRRVLVVPDSLDASTLGRINEAAPHFFACRSGADSAHLRQEMERLLGDHRRALRQPTEEPQDEDRNRHWGTNAHKDPLTGLYNHRTFQERFREELARAQRYGNSLSILYGDIDKFSALNELSGFELGDEIIQRIASIVRSQTGSRVRSCDIASRFGGQEFAILLPETDKEGAAIKADRLRKAVAGTTYGSGLNVTISFGVAGYPNDGADAESLLRCALSSLRRAKEHGRNCVEIYEPTQRERADLLSIRGESFPTFHNRMGDLVQRLERDRMVSCLYIDLSRLRRIEREFGVAQHSQLFARAGEILSELRGQKLRHDDLVCRTDDADAYLCFICPPRQPDAKIEYEPLLARLTEVLESGLAEAMRGLTRDLPQVAIGMARILENPMIRGERLIVRVVEDAKHSAALAWEQTAHQNKALLQDIIIGDQLRTVFQPIVDLENSTSFAYEALTRGPEASMLESPTALFAVADAVDLTVELDRACFRHALACASGCQPVHRLFLNLLPQSFHDIDFVEGDVVAMLDQLCLTPANVVFEITERLAIENFSAFRQALSRYTDMGFGVAIDDVGTRHSNLESVMALRPHFIKLSEVLCRGVAQSTVKREMVRSLQRIAETIDAVTVAEGIENKDDLGILRELGVRFGQGYYLRRPNAAFGDVSEEVCQLISEMPPRRRSGVIASGPPSFAEDDFNDATAPKLLVPTVDPGADGNPWKPLDSEVAGPSEDRSLLSSLKDERVSDGFDDEPTRTRGGSPVN